MRMTTEVEEPIDQGQPDRLRITRRATLAAIILGAATFALTWALDHRQVPHPHPLPPLLLFLALAGATLIALTCGIRALLRGPRRRTAMGLILVSLIPLGLWGYVGYYGWSHWQRRMVPNTPPMRLAKMAAMPLMRLEAAVEYPNRLETERLVMHYGRLENPRRDAEEMERHLARMETMFGGPLRGKVIWVRGHLPRLGLSGLSIHGIALGSGESPMEWETEGGFDRHELAHAALDLFRDRDADPPFVLHEGWAESQDGSTPAELARMAWEQREVTPTLGLREMFGPDWYHQDSGPVYTYGGAFVDFVLRKHGIQAFLRLYNECRPETFEDVIRSVLGSDLDAVEVKFWEDVRRLAILQEVGDGGLSDIKSAVLDGCDPKKRSCRSTLRLFLH